MHLFSADQLLKGTVLLVVPHYDDEILACGGTLALLSDKSKVHLVFATAGDSMPIKTRRSYDGNIGAVRREESRLALEDLGISEEQCHHLNIPEGKVQAKELDVAASIQAVIDQINPDILLAPFRYDQHRDHLALNRICTSMVSRLHPAPELLEYFVYVNYPLLPRKDIRRYCKPDLLRQVDISSVSETKKGALNRFVSQTTLYYPDQCRPVLSAELIEDYCASPEFFLSAEPNRNVCMLPHIIIESAQWLQPILKAKKEKLRYWLSFI